MHSGRIDRSLIRVHATHMLVHERWLVNVGHISKNRCKIGGICNLVDIRQKREEGLVLIA